VAELIEIDHAHAGHRALQSALCSARWKQAAQLAWRPLALSAAASRPEIVAIESPGGAPKPFR
jgi:hypothetical protein